MQRTSVSRYTGSSHDAEINRRLELSEAVTPVSVNNYEGVAVPHIWLGPTVGGPGISDLGTQDCQRVDGFSLGVQGFSPTDHAMFTHAVYAGLDQSGERNWFAMESSQFKRELVIAIRNTGKPLSPEFERRIGQQADGGFPVDIDPSFDRLSRLALEKRAHFFRRLIKVASGHVLGMNVDYATSFNLDSQDFASLHMLPEDFDYKLLTGLMDLCNQAPPSLNMEMFPTFLSQDFVVGQISLAWRAFQLVSFFDCQGVVPYDHRFVDQRGRLRCFRASTEEAPMAAELNAMADQMAVLRSNQRGEAVLTLHRVPAGSTIMGLTPLEELGLTDFDPNNLQYGPDGAIERERALVPEESRWNLFAYVYNKIADFREEHPNLRVRGVYPYDLSLPWYRWHADMTRTVPTKNIPLTSHHALLHIDGLKGCYDPSRYITSADNVYVGGRRFATNGKELYPVKSFPGTVLPPKIDKQREQSAYAEAGLVTPDGLFGVAGVEVIVPSYAPGVYTPLGETPFHLFWEMDTRLINRLIEYDTDEIVQFGITGLANFGSFYGNDGPKGDRRVVLVFFRPRALDERATEPVIYPISDPTRWAAAGDVELSVKILRIGGDGLFHPNLQDMGLVGADVIKTLEKQFEQPLVGNYPGKVGFISVNTAPSMEGGKFTGGLQLLIFMAKLRDAFAMHPDRAMVCAAPRPMVWDNKVFYQGSGEEISGGQGLFDFSYQCLLMLSDMGGIPSRFLGGVREATAEYEKGLRPLFKWTPRDFRGLGGTTADNGTMTRAVALLILGLHAGASDRDIRRAHIISTDQVKGCIAIDANERERYQSLLDRAADYLIFHGS